jgi:hypothetical protein
VGRLAPISFWVGVVPARVSADTLTKVLVSDVRWQEGKDLTEAVSRMTSLIQKR